MMSGEDIIEGKWHDFNKAVGNRSKCAPSCPVYTNCPLSVHAPVCMVKSLEGEDKRRFFMFFYLGEQGLRTEILHSLMELARLLDLKDVDDMRIYMDTLLKVNRQLYGDKAKVQKPVEALKVNITRAMGNTKKNIPTIILAEEDSTTDPQSLYNSAMLGEIIS